MATALQKSTGNAPPRGLAAAARAKPETRSRAPAPGQPDRERRRVMVAEAAYYRAEHRAFAPGHELEDWCGAEAEIDAILSSTPPAKPGA
jgi:hypothetical protein